jgi:hypothetical protein
VILHEIDVMNKLITIQDLKNVKFKFDYDYLHKNLILIEGICNYLINEESYLNSSLNWCFYKDNIDDENIKIDSPFNIITDLPYIELFDVKLILDNCKVKLKGNIINIEIKDNIKTITVKSNDVYLYKNDTCKLDIK